MKLITTTICLLAFAAASQAAPVTGPWAFDPSSLATILTGANTASPTVGDGTSNSADSAGIYASFPTITLSNNGNKITLTGSVTVAGILTNASNNQIRAGLYNHNASSDTTGWLGYFGSQGALQPVNSNIAGRIYERTNPNTTWFMSSSSGSAVATNNPAGGPGVELTDGTYNFSLSIEQVAGGLQISTSIIRASDSTNFVNFSYLDTTPSTTSFDRVGFLIGNGLDADLAQFSNIDVTYSDAPATPISILSAGFNGAAFDLVVSGFDITKQYVLKRSANLQDSFPTTAAGPFTPTDVTNTVSDLAPPAGQAFYRVELVP